MLILIPVSDARSAPLADWQARPYTGTFDVAHEPSLAPLTSARLSRATGEVRRILHACERDGAAAAAWYLTRSWMVSRLMDAVVVDEARSVLAAFPGLAGVAVVEHADRAGECLIGYVVPSGPGLDVRELHAHARKALRGAGMPAAIVVVDEIPVTAAGAADAAALPVPELSGLLPYRAPGTARQEMLCELFAEVLGVARCGIDSDFFDLGGRSIDAMMLAGRISTALGTRISMADLFKAPTVADMDRRLGQLADARK